MRGPDLVACTRRYFAALEAGVTGADLAAFFSEDVVQVEFPNFLTPQTITRDLSGLLDGAARGKMLMESQRYQIQNLVCEGQQVVAEVAWTGILALTVGSLQAGDTMRARFAVFLEFDGEKISRQRNYDCFTPF